jgi:hypothetical protein
MAMMAKLQGKNLKQGVNVGQVTVNNGGQAIVGVAENHRGEEK